MSIRGGAVAVVVALAVALPGAPAPAQPSSDRAQDARERRDQKTPRLAPAARDALSRALNVGRLTQAEYALQRVRSLLDLKGVRREFGAVEAPEGRHATMLFRDLALRLSELEGPDREAAGYLLARPDDSADGDPKMPDGSVIKYEKGALPTDHLCSNSVRRICVHWVDAPESIHRATLAQAQLTLATLEQVWDAEIDQGGFRAPKPDHTGLNGAMKDYLDVYLADVGGVDPFPVYGYCTTDDPNTLAGSTYDYFDVSAYCVLDNDYAIEQFPGDPEDNLKVTAAHEFFHAVQFGYDVTEDFWLMEGTATAIEDHVYDDINDNYQFLLASQLVAPQVPTDRSDFGRDYGAWVFWRFMSEYLGDPGVANLEVLRAVWEQADGAEPPEGEPDPPDRFSAKAAVAASSKDFGVPFRQMFADYGVALQLPVREQQFDGFEEGAGYVAFLDAVGETRKTTHKAILLRPAVRRARWTPKVNHLAHKYAAISKGNAVAKRRVKLILDLPRKKRGSVATLLPFAQDGSFMGVRRISLDRQGDGKVKMGPKMRRAIVVLTNASTRFKDCWFAQTQFSCMGKPRDNGLTYDLRARLLN